MVTRLSSQFMHYQKTDSMMHSQSQLADKYQRITTGKRLLQSADDPAAAAENLQINQTQARLAQYKTARNFSQHQMQSQLQVVEKMEDLSRRVKQTFVAVSNQSIMSEDARQAYATELESLKSELMGLANSKDSSGNYLFAGYQTDTAPLIMNSNGAVSYQGSQDAIKQHIDADREVTVNFTAQQVLQSATGADIFQSLDLAISTLKTPYQAANSQAQSILAANIDSAHSDLQNTMKTLATISSQLGSQLKEVEQSNSRSEDISLLLKERQSQLTDTDMAAEISEYYQEEAILQASYGLFAQMKDLSLFKILR
jgi:flagellar hook-associated protein 3 FlgL